ncbi:hypothetical protein ACXAT3_001427 [Clostridium sporogenes]
MKKTLFDFEHCAYGWRIHDLSVVLLILGIEIIDFQNDSIIWKDKKIPTWANEIL